MSALGKNTTLWAIVLTVVVTAGSCATLLLAVPQLSDGSQALRDYSLSASPSSLSMSQGQTATITLTATSVNGFDLSIGMSTAVSMGVGSFLLASLSSNVVTPTSYGSATSTLTITSLTGTPAGTYQIMISSSGGTRSHSVTVTVIVGPADFTILANPSFMTDVQGQYNTTTLTLTSLGGFTGNVSLTGTAPLTLIGLAGAPSPVHLVAGGSATAILSIDASSLTTPGTYTITATGTSGKLTHSIDIQVLVKAPPSVMEALSLDSYSFNSTTSVTLYIRNTGTVAVTFASYYVKDAYGDQYALTSWAGPSISPNAVAPTSFLIGSSCSGCTLTGSAFTFTPGYAYTVTVVTSRNNQFTFTVTR